MRHFRRAGVNPLRAKRVVVPMLRRFLVFLCLALATGAAPAATSAETRLLTLDGHVAAVDVYAPAAPARALAVIAHGFTRSRAQHVVLAERLAEAGFLVAVPDLPHWAQHEANADAIVALVAEIGADRPLESLPVVLIGTSAGGLAALLATDRVPRLALWIGLDPVDAFGQSRAVARNLHVPAVVLRAPNGACNVGGSARRIAAWLPKRRIERRIDGASHCDFEDTTNWRCESICGPADAARQSRIVEETVKLAREAVPD
jgi:predicted dienelactone hydrolase